MQNECLVCSREYELKAHHIESRTYAPTLELSIENGVILCKEHHKEFHRTYSKSSIDRQYLLGWISRKKKEKWNHFRAEKRRAYWVNNYYDEIGKLMDKHETILFLISLMRLTRKKY